MVDSAVAERVAKIFAWAEQRQAIRNNGPECSSSG